MKKQRPNPKLLMPTLSTLAGIVILVVLLYTAPAFAVWGEAVLGVGLLLGALVAADTFIFREFNTLHEIRNGNVAYALLLVAAAIVILAAAIIVG
jgi:hypothetical protein